MINKRLISFIILILIMNVSFCFAANPKVQINGEIIDFTDSAGNKVEAQIINDRTMVPLRKIFEVLSCNVDWQDDTKTVVATKDDVTITLQIGNKDASISKNGEDETITLDSEPVIIQGRTLVPFRFIGESLGMTVAWDQANATAIIIDYDSLAQIIKSKSSFLYSNGLGNKISITKKYFDLADSSFDGTTTMTIFSDDQNVNVKFTGNSDFSKEVEMEEWNDFDYNIDSDNNILTSNYAFSSMLKITKNSKTQVNFAQYGLSRKSANKLGDWIKNVAPVDSSAINIKTYSELKSDINKLAKTFLSSGVTLSGQDFEFTHLDMEKVFSQRYGTRAQEALLLLNKVLFRYNTNFFDILSDYPRITYSFNNETNSAKVNITMENDYNEKIQYEVIFSM